MADNAAVPKMRMMCEGKGYCIADDEPEGTENMTRPVYLYRVVYLYICHLMRGAAPEALRPTHSVKREVVSGVNALCLVCVDLFHGVPRPGTAGSHQIGRVACSVINLSLVVCV